MKPNHRSLGPDFLLLAAIWGTSFMFMRLGTLGFGPVSSAGLRISVAALALLPLLRRADDWRLIRAHALPLTVVGVLNTTIPFSLYSYALLHISTGLTAILNASIPLFGALVAWLWLKERPGRWRTVGLGLGFLGISLLSWRKVSLGGSDTLWAVLACLCATLCYGIAASCTRIYLRGVPALSTAGGSLLGAALVSALPTLLAWPDHAPGLSAWGAVIALGVLCTALAYVVFFRLIALAGAGKALTVTFMAPLFALLYASLLLGESITPWMVICGGIILLGVALATEYLRPGNWLARHA
ncbi:MAG: hypothetical protein RJA36_3707 [Pseudomonadota bacterium]|jgi:drug/metabolite transporter (DMT)-like permease